MTQSPPPIAVIFDFDGVLFETEPVHCRALADTLSAYGVDLPWDEYAKRYVGLSDREIFARLAERFTALRGVEFAEVLDAKSRRYEALTRSDVKPLAGAVEAIEQFRAASIPLAICSGSMHREIRRLLSGSGLRNHFDPIVATEDVSKSKPDPEGYLLALKKLRETQEALKADHCIVFEDSGAGIEAALAAGMVAIGLRKNYGVANRAMPSAWIKTLAEADVAFVRKMINSRD